MKIRFNPLRLLMVLLLMAVIWYGFKIEVDYNGEFFFEFYLLPLNRFF